VDHGKWSVPVDCVLDRLLECNMDHEQWTEMNQWTGVDMDVICKTKWATDSRL